MLLPRFTLRTALICLTVAAFVSLLFREGARGTEWALGVTIGIASLFLWLLLMAFFFGISMIFRFSSQSMKSERLGEDYDALLNRAETAKQVNQQESKASIASEQEVDQPRGTSNE